MTSTPSSLQQVHPPADPLLEQVVEGERQESPARAGLALADFGSTAHRLFAEATLDDTVAVVTEIARHRYAADAAGVVLLDKGGTPAPVEAHDPAATRLDGLQVSCRQGPAWQAACSRACAVSAVASSSKR